MRRSLAVLTGPVLALLACAPAPAPPPDTGAALTALKEADAAYAKAGAAKDLEAFLAFYAPDAAGYPPGEPTFTGAEATRSYLTKYFQDTAFAVTFSPVSAEVSADGTMGYTLNMAELRATGPDGKPMSEKVRDFHVWRKQADGAWKLVIDIWNAEP